MEHSVVAMLTSAVLLTVTLLSAFIEARRYRTCDEGCCLHEYCAYHRICYPRIHCSLGCPDGQCVGQDHQSSESVPQKEVDQSREHGASSTNFNKPNVADVLPRPQILSERYSYRDAPESPTRDNLDVNVKGTNHQSALSDSSSAKEVPNGICMPLKPCQKGDHCGLGYSCTFNYNLGYAVCQYNLDIGSTLCYDNKGNPILQSLS